MAYGFLIMFMSYYICRNLQCSCECLVEQNTVFHVWADGGLSGCMVMKLVIICCHENLTMTIRNCRPFSGNPSWQQCCHLCGHHDLGPWAIIWLWSLVSLKSHMLNAWLHPVVLLGSSVAFKNYSLWEKVRSLGAWLWIIHSTGYMWNVDRIICLFIVMTL